MYGEMFRAMAQWQSAAMSAAQIGVSAAMVIQMRMMQMALGTMSPAEATRMVFEKQTALARSTERSARALAANKGPAAVTAAALAPYRTATRANAKRLARQDPTRPKGSRR
ncbi:hypothetical protein [Pseudooceanicola sp. LIPI14-2-Ac024]|uniref:hypothetical protein n=1 Tax=Pseudooceanicola sp. LIPI14-2-Ac024 TaxID=3344875 RepID=UPI0035D00E1C